MWLVSDDLGGEHAECGGPGLVWSHMVWLDVLPNSPPPQEEHGLLLLEENVLSIIFSSIQICK